MKTVMLRCATALVCLLFVVPGWACAQSKGSRFYLRDNLLWRGKRPVTIRAIEARALAHPDTSEESIIRTLNHIADVGGNGVSFDLHGFSRDGRALSEEGVKALRQVIELVRQRWMHPVCRVLGGDAPSEPEFRKAAVQTAATTFEGDDRLVYWIDGSDCAALVAEFRKQAPDLVVAAPREGDIEVVKALAAANPNRPLLLVGSIPGSPTDSVHFLLPEGDQSYEAMEKAMLDPIESKPWFPDDTILSAEERADGWIALFDGKTLDGWTFTGSGTSGFVARDGIIELSGAGSGMLRTRDRYENFILRLEWKITRKGNSGVFLRAPRASRASWIGMEVQLLGDYGKAPYKGCTGAIYDVQTPSINAGRPAGEWNSLEIKLDGPHLTAVLNGSTIHDIDLDEHDELRYRLRRGFIALQDHRSSRGAVGFEDNRYHAAFRNIRIKPL